VPVPRPDWSGRPHHGRDGRATSGVPWHKDAAPASCRLRGAAESAARISCAGKMPALRSEVRGRMVGFCSGEFTLPDGGVKPTLHQTAPLLLAGPRVTTPVAPLRPLQIQAGSFRGDRVPGAAAHQTSRNAALLPRGGQHEPRAHLLAPSRVPRHLPASSIGNSVWRREVFGSERPRENHVRDPSSGPRRLVSTPVAVHLLPSAKENTALDERPRP